METWAFQARLIGLSQHRNLEKVPQGHPPIKGFWLFAAGHSARHEEKGTQQKQSLVGGSGLSFLLEGGCYIKIEFRRIMWKRELEVCFLF